MQDKIRAAGYVRVSTAEQEQEGFSLDEQERRVAAYCEMQNAELVAVYREAITGRRDDRPELSRLLYELDGLDAVVILKIDRLGRGARYLLELFERFDADGVRLVSLHESIDTSTAAGRAFQRFLAIQAEMESDMISERVRAVTRARAAAGRPHGGLRAYGYRYAKGRGLVIVPLEAEVVRRIFAECAAGRSQRQIATGLRADGIPTPRGGTWRAGTVASILRNPVYKGCVRLKGELFPGNHEPLVDPALWDRVAALLDARAKSKGKGRGRPPKGRHLFRNGMLRCGECGDAMVPVTKPNRASEPWEVYMCWGRQEDVESCSMTPVRRAEIDSAVYAYFEQVGLDVEATRRQLEQARKRKLAELRALRVEAEREARLAEERLQRVRRDYQDGKLVPDDWAEQREQLTEERAGAQAEAERHRAAEAEATEFGELRDVEEETLRRLSDVRAAIVGEVRESGELDAVRAALTRLFEGFVFHRAESSKAPARLHAELALGPGGYVIEPLVRERAVEGYSQNLTPVLRREPLAQATSDLSEKEHNGLTT